MPDPSPEDRAAARPAPPIDPVRFPLVAAVVRTLERRSIPLVPRSPPTGHRPAVFLIEAEAAEWECVVEIHEDRELVAFRSLLPIEIPPERIEPVAALAAHLNATRLVGHFAVEPATGAIRLVTARRFADAGPSPETLVWMLGENLLAVDAHLEAFCLVGHADFAPRDALTTHRACGAG